MAAAAPLLYLPAVACEQEHGIVMISDQSVGVSWSTFKFMHFLLCNLVWLQRAFARYVQVVRCLKVRCLRFTR